MVKRYASTCTVIVVIVVVCSLAVVLLLLLLLVLLLLVLLLLLLLLCLSSPLDPLSSCCCYTIIVWGFRSRFYSFRTYWICVCVPLGCGVMLQMNPSMAFACCNQWDGKREMDLEPNDPVVPRTSRSRKNQTFSVSSSPPSQDKERSL